MGIRREEEKRGRERETETVFIVSILSPGGSPSTPFPPPAASFCEDAWEEDG